MVAFNYGLTQDLQTASSNAHDTYANASAGKLTHDGKLAMGPAVILASGLSLVCWGAIIGGIYLIIH